MSDVTETVLTHILAAHPGAKIEEREDGKFVLIPVYDIMTDTCSTIEKRVVPDPVETKVGILPVMNLRTGPNFNPAGDARVSPTGKLYRILGVTPPPKEDDK